MFTKAVAISSIAALAGQALAANAHRHGHQADKRDVVVDWVTTWETVYATPGGEQFVHDVRPTLTCADVTVTSTSTVVVPAITSNTPAQSPSYPPTPSSSISSQGTTLSVSIRPSLPASSASSVVKSTSTTNAPPPSSTMTTSTTTSQARTIEAVSPSPSPTKPASSNPPPSGSPFRSKKGMAYNDGSLANTFGSQCPGCTWAYNWGQYRSGLDPKYDHAPMLWGPQPMHSNGWDNAAQAALASGAKALFSFNECDNGGQCNMAAGPAAAAHVQFMNKYKGKALISSPSITNSNLRGEGIDWLTAFMAACDQLPEKCAIDFCPVHWYSPASDPDSLFSHLDAAHKACNYKPIWLTEWAPLGTNDEAAKFISTVIPKLEALPYLHAYSYFMVSADSLMSSSNSLSGVGQAYASA